MSSPTIVTDEEVGLGLAPCPDCGTPLKWYLGDARCPLCARFVMPRERGLPG